METAWASWLKFNPSVPFSTWIRPHGSDKEVPTKFNLFNARVETLSSKQSWRHLVGRNHCVMAVKQFYEFVDKKEIGIAPTSGELLKFAAIYDEWTSPELSFKSFAIITGPPPESVLALGHHRCPITLSSEQVDDWLTADNSSDAIDILYSAQLDVYKKAA